MKDFERRDMERKEEWGKHSATVQALDEIERTHWGSKGLTRSDKWLYRGTLGLFFGGVVYVIFTGPFAGQIPYVLMFLLGIGSLTLSTVTLMILRGRREKINAAKIGG